MEAETELFPFFMPRLEGRVVDLFELGQAEFLAAIIPYDLYGFPPSF